MQSSFVGEKKKFSQDLKHSHHRVVRTSSSSRAVTQYSLRLLLARRKFGKSSSRCETTSKRFRVRAKIEEETFTCQRFCIYNKCKQLEKKTSEKRTKNNQKIPSSVHLKKHKHFSHKKEENERRNYFINNTHTKTTTTTTRTRRATTL